MERSPESLSVAAAAVRLGITENALRQRITKRGITESAEYVAHREDGQWRVTLRGPAAAAATSSTGSAGGSDLVAVGETVVAPLVSLMRDQSGRLDELSRRLEAQIELGARLGAEVAVAERDRDAARREVSDARAEVDRLTNELRVERAAREEASQRLAALAMVIAAQSAPAPKQIAEGRRGFLARLLGGGGKDEASNET
jgi:chromosome segregation ATPase